MGDTDDDSGWKHLQFFNEDKVSQFLKCPMCAQIFNNPKRLVLCGHTFCSQCLLNLTNADNWGRCPVCHDIFQKDHIQGDLIANKIIDDLRVSCNRTPECQWSGSVHNHRTHLSHKECVPKTNIS